MRIYLQAVGAMVEVVRSGGKRSGSGRSAWRFEGVCVGQGTCHARRWHASVHAPTEMSTVGMSLAGASTEAADAVQGARTRCRQHTPNRSDPRAPCRGAHQLMTRARWRGEMGRRGD